MACAVSGRLKSRATVPERTLARICREAGARVKVNTKLRDMNVSVSAGDEREIEVMASGLPLFGGAQLAIDITLRSVLTADGDAHAGAASEDGAILVGARREKEAKYAELLAGRRCRLVVMALETGGRWSEEAWEFLCLLARARARDAPARLRGAAALGWARRWSRMLAVSCANAVTTTLVASPRALDGQLVDGVAPALSELLGRW